MHILSIETSCDETAAAIIEWRNGAASVIANIVSSQASLHAKWGGVVPDLASREHIRNIVPVIEEALESARIDSDAIDLIAVTAGPGLMPALIVGVSAAKTLALAWNKPLLGIHHLEGHIYANFVSESPKLKTQNPKDAKGKSDSTLDIQHSTFPLIALVVSGGHTQLVLMRGHFQYEILGETQDDAAGEAFDKVAKMLGLPYPGGPIVAKRADSFREATVYELKTQSYPFPRPMINSDDFNFSFSGLKTSVLYTIKKVPEENRDETFIDEICHEFQEAVVDVLVAKTKKALEQYPAKTFVIAGGVSANVRLRNQLRNMIDTQFPDTTFLTPEFKYSLDNAAMIGIAAAYRYDRMNDAERAALIQTPLTLDPDANLPLR